jgi:hypothetical protein
MNRRFALLGVLLLSAAAPADPAADPEEVIRDRKAFMPWRKHGPLKGTVIGVLASDVSGVMAREGRGGPPDAMAFSASGDSYRWVYVSVTEKPAITDLKVEVGEKPGEKTKTYPKVSFANSVLVKRWDIHTRYALVEAEVNDGEGAPPGEGFVATRMTRLDGGKKYVLDVTNAVDEALKRHRVDLKKKEKAIAAAIEAEAKKAIKGGKLTGPRQDQSAVYASWLPGNERLRVAVRTVVTDGAFTVLERPLIIYGPWPTDYTIRTGTRIEAELGFAYEFDRNGKLVRVQTMPVAVKSEVLNPPGPARR